jgi:site-specific DNA-methyltransferase (adenine-specific)
VVNRESGGLRSLDKGDADDSPCPVPDVVAQIAGLAPSSAYVWCSTEQVSDLRREFVKAKYTTRQCGWEKSNPSPMNAQAIWLSSVELCVFARRPKAVFNRFYESPVWRGPSERVADFPTPKPVWLMREAIDASSLLGDTVLDPFMGSGSTGVAAVQLGRKFIGIEKNKAYADIAIARIGGELARKRLEQGATK